MKEGKKRLVGNLSRANCLVRVRCHSFTLSFSVTSILSVSLPLSLTLSRPPEGSTLELHENQSLPVSRPPPFHLVVMCVCFGGGVGVLSTFFCASLVLFGRLNPIHLKNKSLGICLRWRGLIKQSKPSLASLCAPLNTWLHDLHSDWLVRRWDSNSCCFKVCPF